MKRCASCHQTKPLGDFPRCGSSSTGRYSYCRGCKALKAKSERQRHAARYKAARKAQYAREREKAIKAARAWAIENPEARARIEADYRERNRERVRQFNRDYYNRDVDAARARARAMNHRRRLMLTGSDDEAVDFATVLRSDPCCYCGAPVRDIDHIVPVAAGGAGEWDNLTGSCQTCNRRKGTRSLLEFLLGRRR